MPSKADIKATYVHYFKPAEPTSYPEGFSHILITKPEKVDKLLRLIESIDEVSVDLEATSLNTEIADIVGIGLCFEETRSFYLPIRHKVDEEQNLPESTIKLIYDEVIKKKKTLWYNFTYDGALWEKEGHDIELVDFYDVMGLVWLADTNIKKIPLDWAAGHFLGWQNIMKFKEMIGSLENFSYLSPEDAKFYACTDPLATFNLYKLLYPAMSKECPFTLNLDNKVVLPLIRGQAEDHLIGKKELLEVSDEIDAHLPELEKEIYKETGKVFDINSPAQVADALESLGLDTGARTKGGKLVTRADLLDKLDHPVAQKIVEFKHLANMKGSFINPFMPYADGAKKCRFKYFLWAVPCLTENAMVLTEESVKSIADIKSSRKIWTRFGWKDFCDWTDVGVQDVLKIVTVNGYEIEGTLHHPILSDGVWKSLGSLKVGDRVDISLSHPCGFVEWPIEYSCKDKYYGSRTDWDGFELPTRATLEFCRLLGFLAGDGSVVSDGIKLCYWKEDIELIEYYNDLFVRLFKKKPGGGGGSLGIKDNTISYKFCSVVIRDFVKWTEAKDDRIPKIVVKGGPDAIGSYIAGYFDADGSLSRSGNSLDWRIGSKSRSRIEEVHKALNILGYRSHIGEKNGKQLYVRMISPKLISDFQKAYPPIGRRKSCDGFDVEKSLKRRRRLVGTFDLVKIVGEVERKRVYDITVDEVGEFVANGIVTHNTGRFSSGKDEKNPYFAGVNIQAIVKPHMVKKYAHYVGDGQGILGWIFNDVESDREVEVPEERRNVRRAFKAPEGWWYVRADYTGQELRIPANLSGETVWIEAFLDKRDIHNEVCKDVFGEPTSEKRKMTKAVNFGIIYGSTPYSFSKKFNKTEEEGVEFYARYKKKHPRLFAWIESEQRKAQLRGVCYTPFGRPRRLYHYFQSVDRKVRAFAQRSTTNSIVQGGAADIFRIGFVNLYHRLYKKYPLESRFQMAVHDEMDSLIKKGSEHLIDLMVEILTLRRKDWPVPMEVGIEVGTSWGDLVGFVKEDEEWRPKRKER